MSQLLDPDRFSIAAARFRDFFAELDDAFVEREDILIQFQLALLLREHVLMTGYPGTDKSRMASAVLGRIVDESIGQPGGFALEFTETTVETDVAGPIVCKALVQSARAERVTDQAIPGAVHVFLNEAFDGRDALLGARLGDFGEREPDRAGAPAVGRIDSAFMTSNRHIAEILHSSREAVFALLDRMAFVSFVPRGFADPENFSLVVRRHGGGFGRHTLSAQLSVQDLHVLQAAVERAFVPEPICDGLSQLVRELHAEQAAAMRTDREYQPTRSLSTETAVRSARVLRAAAVREQIFGHGRPDCAVGWDELSYLRYQLILAGLDRERVAALLEHETDPRELRQLAIMHKEAEIFERCLCRVPRVHLSSTRPHVDMDAFEGALTRARGAGDTALLVDTAQALARASESGAAGADNAARLITETIGALSGHALKAGLVPELPGDRHIEDIAAELAGIADDLERATGLSRPLARWLRGRMLELVDEKLRLTSMVTAETVELLVRGPSRSELSRHIDARLRAVETVHRLRHRLQVNGAWIRDMDTSKGIWTMALSKLEDELVLLWDALFREGARDLLATASTRRLSEVLAGLRPHVTTLDEDAARIAALGAETGLRERVIGPIIEPMVAACFERMHATERAAVVEEVAEIVRELHVVGLSRLMDPVRLVTWAASALLRAECARKEGVVDGASDNPDVNGTHDVHDPDIHDARDFEAAERGEDPLSLLHTLVVIALKVVPFSTLEPEHPELSTRAVWKVVRDIPDELATRVADLDLARIERGVGRLRNWWGNVSRDSDRTDRTSDLLERAVKTGFLRVMRSTTPLRLAMEANHLSEVFPDRAGRANQLRRRLRTLDSESTGLLVELLEERSRARRPSPPT